MAKRIIGSTPKADGYRMPAELPIADKYDIRVIMMITPETSEERIRFIDEHTDGFIYMVSSARQKPRTESCCLRLSTI